MCNAITSDCCKLMSRVAPSVSGQYSRRIEPPTHQHANTHQSSLWNSAGPAPKLHIHVSSLPDDPLLKTTNAAVLTASMLHAPEQRSIRRHETIQCRLSSRRPNRVSITQQCNFNQCCASGMYALLVRVSYGAAAEYIAALLQIVLVLVLLLPPRRRLHTHDGADYSIFVGGHSA